MVKSVALVLPARNEAHSIKTSFGSISDAVKDSPDVKFTLFPIDDGSTDGTHGLMHNAVSELDLDARIVRNPTNIGLASSLRKAYGEIVGLGYDAVLKTDLDIGSNRYGVIRLLISQLSQGYDSVFAIHNPTDSRFTPSDAAMKRKLAEMLEIVGISASDPHTTVYRSPHLAKLLKTDAVANYGHRWGMDFLLAVLSNSMNALTKTLVFDVNYDPKRRPDSKVNEQFLAYAHALKGVFPDVAIPS